MINLENAKIPGYDRPLFKLESLLDVKSQVTPSIFLKKHFFCTYIIYHTDDKSSRSDEYVELKFFSLHVDRVDIYVLLIKMSSFPLRVEYLVVNSQCYT